MDQTSTTGTEHDDAKFNSMIDESVQTLDGDELREMIRHYMRGTVVLRKGHVDAEIMDRFRDDYRHKLTSRVNEGDPRLVVASKYKAMSDEDLSKALDQMLWLSAFTGNNPRSDYHWHVDLLYAECSARGKPELYSVAYERVKETCR